MPDAEAKQMQDTAERSGECRAFRYQLWSHAASEFQPPATRGKRSKSRGADGAANGSAGDTPQPQSGSVAEVVSDSRSIR